MRRIPLALVLVGVMSLLAAGGAVLGVFQAPTGNDLTVHNGAGETLQADHVEGSYTTSGQKGTVVSFVFQSPDHLSEEEIGPTGKVEARRSLSGPKASSVLAPVRDLLSLGSFSPHGAYFDNTRPASVLVSPAERPSVSGTYRTRVLVQGGYVVALFLRIEATVQETSGPKHINETFTYHLSRVDGWTRSR